MDNSILSGPGYSATIKPGGQWRDIDPYGTVRAYFPPGAMPAQGSAAMVLLEPVPVQQVEMLLYYMSGMQDPFIGSMNAQSLGISQVLNVGPMRNSPIGASAAYIREFEGIGAGSGLPYRVTIIVMVGAGVALKVVIAIQLRCWAQFTGACLEFVASISLGGGAPATDTTIQMVIDPTRRDQVEYQAVNPDQTRSPLLAMPVYVQTLQVMNIDQSIHTGNIDGNTSVALGSHTLSSVNKEGHSA